MSSFGLSRIFIEIPGGLLADKFGKKPIILIGYLLSLTSHIFAGFARNPAELIISRMLMGVGSALLFSSSLTYIGEISTRENRGKFVSYFQSTFSIAGIVGPTLGGLISEALGLRSIFFISSFLSAIGLIVVLSLKMEEKPEFKTEKRKINSLEIIKNFRIIVLSSCSFIMFFYFSSIRGTLIPLYGTQNLGLNSVQISLIFSLSSIIVVLSMIFINQQLEKLIKRALLLTISLLACSVSIFLLSVAWDFNSLAVLFVPLGFSFGIFQPLPFAMIIDNSEPNNRGLTIGISRTIADFGIILGPIIAGWLLDLGQPRLTFYLVASLFGLLSYFTYRIFFKGNNSQKDL
jgi:DHA1 family multidrug resistance protein-like MFS transporter